MERTMFNDPVPANQAEMIEAIDEALAENFDLYARLEKSEETDGDYVGWLAEIEDSQGNVVCTCGYSDKAALIADLKSVGVTTIDEMA